MRAKLVNENISFERGQDPKSSMDIGTQKIHRDIIDNTPWSANLSPEVYDIVTLIPDYMGHPILVVKMKDPITNKHLPYSAVSDLSGTFSTLEESPESAIKAVENRIKRIKGPKLRYSVDESVNFERGQDPKDSMRIGINANVMKFLQWVKNDFQLNKDHPDYFGYINLGYTGGEDYIFKDPEMQDGYERFVKDYKKYLPIMKEMGLYITSKPDIEETIISDDSILDGYAHKVLESINFERGNDPRDSMRIGKKAALKQDASKIDWDWYPPPIDFDGEEVIDLKKYKGFNTKIAKLENSPGDQLGYDERDVYYAVSDTGEPYIDAPTFYDDPYDAWDYEQQFLAGFSKGL